MHPSMLGAGLVPHQPSHGPISAQYRHMEVFGFKPYLPQLHPTRTFWCIPKQPRPRHGRISVVNESRGHILSGSTLPHLSTQPIPQGMGTSVLLLAVGGLGSSDKPGVGDYTSQQKSYAFASCSSLTFLGVLPKGSSIGTGAFP